MMLIVCCLGRHLNSVRAAEGGWRTSAPGLGLMRARQRSMYDVGEEGIRASSPVSQLMGWYAVVSQPEWIRRSMHVLLLWYEL